MARPDYYLVSVEEDPDAAAKLWHERLRRHPYGSDGLVQVSYRGQQMIQADAWDDVVGIWLILTRVADAVESRSELDDYFNGQPLPVRVQPKGRGASVTIGDVRTYVEANSFVAPLRAEAERFFSWMETSVGLARPRN